MATAAAMRIAGDNDRALPKKLTLTKSIIERLECPKGKRVHVVYDAKCPGLCIHVSSDGRKAFYIYRKVKGRPIRYKLFSYPDKTIEQARDKARKDIGEMADGKDPREERKAIRESDTLEEVFNRWENEHAKLRHTPKTIATDKSRFDTCFDGWKNRKVASIGPQHVRALHTELGKERGKVTANRAVQLLRRLMYWARINPNPAGEKEVNLFPENERERFIESGEWPKFFESLNQEPNDTLRDFFYACLFTGQRRTNVCTMRWEEIDAPSSTWIIPGTKTKNHKPHRVHLAPQMLSLLDRRRIKAETKAADGDERYTRGYVFPSYRQDAKHPHLTEPKGAWKRLLARAGLTDLRIHDLRRSLGSWATMTGANQQIVGKALGHLDQSSTAIYARLNLDPVRVSVNTALAAIEAAANGGKTRKLAGSIMDGDGVLSEPTEIIVETQEGKKEWVAKLTVPATYKGSSEGLRIIFANATRAEVKGKAVAGCVVELAGDGPV
ncbi:MAG TPA: tyrosine-type recombinase/integrase [Tepidisphaeraceae bacterium]|jgi:integrase